MFPHWICISPIIGPCQDKFWKYSTNLWKEMDVTEDNVDDLSQHAAAGYLAEIEWGLSSRLSLPQGKKHKCLDMFSFQARGLPHVF